ncbi:MAG: serine hydrolase domain-containing protein [Actinomycetota bacterium]
MTDVRALELTSAWPVPNVAAAVVAGDRRLDSIGPIDQRFRLASISKPMTAWAVLVAVEEGIVSLDDPYEADDPTRTLRHLLAHAAGFGVDTAAPIVAAERKRIYSNSGIELAARLVEAASGMAFADYLREAVFEPLGMADSALDGSPAHQVWSTVDDVARFTAEVTAPRLLSASTSDDARRIQYPALGGIVPGVGRFGTSPWGLGFEIRGNKQPHWTGTRNSPGTHGHFGGSGTMAWIDPAATADDRPIALIALTDRPFEQWADDALRLWPALSDAVLDEFAAPAATGAPGAG